MKLDLTCPKCGYLQRLDVNDEPIRAELAKVMGVADAQLAVNKDLVRVMERALAQRDAIFAATIERCAALLEAGAEDARQRAEGWVADGSDRMAALKNHEARVLREQAAAIRALELKGPDG